MSRLHPSLRRWLDIILLALLTAPLLFVLPYTLPRAYSFSAAWAEFVGLKHPHAIEYFPAVLYGLLLVPLCLWYINLSGLHLSHWTRHPKLQFLYPPTYFAIILAAAVLSLPHFYPYTFPYPNSSSPTHLTIPFPWYGLPLTFLVCLVITFAVACLLPKSDSSPTKSQTSPPDRTAQQPASLDDLLRDPVAFKAWINSDAPITDRAQDYFGVYQTAEEFANLILAHPDATFGLLGPKGSGKSSIINLVFENLADSSASAPGSAGGSPKQPPRFITCTVSQWGRDDQSAAAAILQAAIKELSNYVDTLAVTNLPEHYLNAVSHARTPWYLAIFLHLCRRQSPDDELARLNNILRIVNHHLIIAVEDLDRNEPEPELRHKYTQLAALLDRLRDHNLPQAGAQAPGNSSCCDHLTFILAADHAAFDFSRLCEFRRFVPALPPESFCKILQRFQGFLQVAADVVDPRSETAKESIWRDWDPFYWSMAQDGGAPSGPFLIADVYRLLCHPRLLKQTLREALQLWANLCGEIDPNDLLICMILRACNHKTFDFIQDKFDLLNQDNAPQGQDLLVLLAQPWASLFHDGSVNDRLRLSRLMSHLFRFSPEGSNTHPFRERPQGVNQTRYWQRAYTGILPVSDLVDQPILYQIQDWKRTHSISLANSLETPGFIEVFVQFQAHPRGIHPDLRLSASEILDLAGQVFQHLLREYNSNASREKSFAFISLWKLIHDRDKDGSNYYDWLVRQIDLTLPVSLRLTLDIEYFWGDSRHHYLTPEQQFNLRHHIAGWINSHWSPSDVQPLLNALACSDAHEMWSLGHLITPAYASQTNDLSWWRPAIPSLLVALQRSPSTMLPMLCALAADGKFQHGHNEYFESTTDIVYTLDLTSLGQLLPTAEDRSIFAKALLSTAVNTPSLPDFARPVVDSVLPLLQKWLDDGLDCPPPPLPPHVTPT